MQELKICKLCDQSKPLSEYFFHKKSGYANACKACVLARQKARYAKNKKQIAERQKIYYQKNREAKLAYIKQYRELHPEATKQWREKNKDHIRQYDQKRRTDNADKIREWNRQWRENNAEHYSQYMKNWKESHKEHVDESIKQWRKNNSEHTKNYRNTYNQAPALYSIFSDMLTSLESPIEGDNGILLVQCAHCLEYFNPTNMQARARVGSLDGAKWQRGERRLYCSDSCKNACDVYGQVKYRKSDNRYMPSREVQPELRKLVFARDNYACQKCGAAEHLHCHHIDPVSTNPLESADVDNCITVCKNCHQSIHLQVGCKPSELAKCLP